MPPGTRDISNRSAQDACNGESNPVWLAQKIDAGIESLGAPSARTLKLGGGGAGLCVSLGSVYLAGSVGAMRFLVYVIACSLCVILSESQLGREIDRTP